MPLRGRSARDCRICWGRLGEALINSQFSPSAVMARLACVRGCTRASPAHARRHVGQRQFHCGKPPPAAEPRTRAVNRPIQDRRKWGSELGRQIPVDLQADADLNEGRGCPGHSSSSLTFRRDKRKCRLDQGPQPRNPRQQPRRRERRRRLVSKGVVPGHDRWHKEFYSKLNRNDGKGTCCDIMDCRPTQSRMVGGAHVCAPRQVGPNKGVIFCVVLPPEG
jgi:hypothetical protein